MNDVPRVLTFHGVRGSVATPGPRCLRYGGNTPCISVRLSPRRWLIVDCGTGLRSLTPELPSDGELSFQVLLTHYHRDHVEGLPHFDPLYEARARFVFRGQRWQGLGVHEALERIMSPPCFPVHLDDTASEKGYRDITPDPFEIDDILVHSIGVRHPQGATAFRLESDRCSVAVVTDSEAGDPDRDAAVVALARRADVLIHDAQYATSEQGGLRGRGHSTWLQAVEIARRAGVKRLLLFHHDPARSDDEIDALVRTAREAFPSVEAASEGMRIVV